MKSLTLILFAIFSLAAASDTTETRRIWFDGTSASETVRMSTEKTRTEYRNVQVRDTCYRTDYRYRCHRTRPMCRRVCDRRGNRCRRVCPPSRRICRNVPVRVPYQCTRTVRQAYEVLDYYVNSEIELNYELEGVQTAREEFLAKVTGASAALSVEDSGDYLILLKNENKEASRDGETLNQKISFTIGFEDAHKIEEALSEGVRDVLFKDGKLFFTLGGSFNAKDFVQELSIYRARRLASDVLIFDKRIAPEQMEISTLGSDKRVAIDIRALGVEIPGRMRIIMKTSFDAKGAKVLNSESVKLKAEANWLFSK